MNNELNIALALLATKLGTTTEHLWGVILRQVPVNAAFDMLGGIVFIVLTAWWVHVVWRNTMIELPDPEYPRVQRAKWYAEGAVLAWGSALVAIFISCTLISCGAPKWIAAFTNPEYIALKEVLSFIKR